MRYLLTAAALELKLRLCRWKFWALLLLVLLGGLAARQIAGPSDGAAVTVGVILPREGGEAFWSGLERRGVGLVRFVPATREEAAAQIVANRWDCALELDSRFDERLRDGDTGGIITLLTGPGSTVYPLVRETAAAVLLELSAPQIARDYLLSREIVSQEALPELLPLLEARLPEEQRVAVSMETADGTALDPVALREENTAVFLQAVTAVALLVWALSAAGDLGRWRESPQAGRLRGSQRLQVLLLPRLLSGLTAAFLLGAAGIAASGGTLLSAAMLLPYLLALGSLALLLARWGRVWTVLPALLPLAAAAGFLLSPVFWDVRELFPALSPLVSWMPVTLYLDSCQGDGGALIRLLGAALLLGIPAAATEAPRRGRDQ